MFLYTNGIVSSSEAIFIPPYTNANSIELDGVGDYLDSSSIYSELDGAQKLTISLWVKPPSTIASLQVIASTIRNATTTNHQFQIRLATNGTVQITNDSNSKYIRASSTPLNLGSWNHLLFCIDLTEVLTADRGRIFINGVNATSGVTLSGSLTNSTGSLNIGRNENGHYGYYEGHIDEFAIWAGTDLRNDISTIYNSGNPNDLNYILIHI